MPAETEGISQRFDECACAKGRRARPGPPVRGVSKALLDLVRAERLGRCDVARGGLRPGRPLARGDGAALSALKAWTSPRSPFVRPPDSQPRPGWPTGSRTRCATGSEWNTIRRVRHQAFRAFVHDVERIEVHIAEAGLRRISATRRFIWYVAVYGGS